MTYRGSPLAELTVLASFQNKSKGKVYLSEFFEKFRLLEAESNINFAKEFFQLRNDYVRWFSKIN
jgi:hypothetical protein